jgi:glucose/arabinose dehydrogenase
MRPWQSLPLCVALLSAAACSKTDYMPNPTPAPISQGFDFRLQDIFAGKTPPDTPMDLQAPTGDPRLFIAERGGKIRVVQAGTLLTAPFLDLSSRVLPLVGEDGLISFVFDPNYSISGFVYVHFIEKNLNANGDIVVERYQVSSTDPNALQTPGIEVIRIPHHEATNHYGGRVMFGPDGKLYLSTGDGGGGNNQFGHAQDATSLLGKMLRIDVSALNPNQVPPYAIPADNPVWPIVGRNEIWAIGLRNPFRPAFDFPTGRLYVADVGQDAREEVDVVDASAAGLNYGWSITEGFLCLGIGGPCTTPGLTAPVYDYDHTQGNAIIGGFVYHGAAIPELQGTYLFSDLRSGFLRGLTLQNGVATVVQAPNANAGTGVTLSFGQDGMGEVYILTATNKVLKIVKP